LIRWKWTTQQCWEIKPVPHHLVQKIRSWSILSSRNDLKSLYWMISKTLSWNLAIRQWKWIMDWVRWTLKYARMGTHYGGFSFVMRFLRVLEWEPSMGYIEMRTLRSWFYYNLIGNGKREYRLFYMALLQKRPIILRSLLFEATPYIAMVWGGYD